MPKKPLFINGLEYKHKLAALLLALGFKQKDVAKQVGLSRRGLENWMAKKEFKEEVDRQTQQHIVLREKALNEGKLDIENEFRKIVARGGASPVRASDVVSALDKLAKIDGKYMSDKARDRKKSKEELKGEVEEVNVFLGKYAKRPDSGQSAKAEGEKE